jgi:hypothetical protein
MDFAQADYASFLASKAPRPHATGIEPGPMHPAMRPDQCDVTAFALRQGCAALFLDTGLGKTFDELEWCRQAADASNGMALLLTPLAVARQIEREAHRWGYEARVIRAQDEAGPGINICNYDRLDALRPDAFGAVALDESSILKSFSGATTRALIAAFQHHRFRLCATATPAPNDHMELGQHAEFLGQMSAMEMLSRWFINDTATASQKWRLKGHAADAFWDWMATWSRCAETPVDLGYDGSGFVLPPMRVIRHRVAGNVKSPAGTLFAADVSATNLHDIKRQTAEARAASVAAIVAAEPGEAWVIWCDTDYEADCLAAAIPGALEVRGSHTPERKEAALADFAAGNATKLITKPSICGYGLNWQHAARMAFVGRSFSYEAWYQAVRREWRFGQLRPVDVHIMVAEGEDQIGRVIDRKSADHAIMKRAMAATMRRANAERSTTMIYYNPKHEGYLPLWLQSAV